MKKTYSRVPIVSKEIVECWLGDYNRLLIDVGSTQIDSITHHTDFANCLWTDARLKKVIIDEAVAEMPGELAEILRLTYIEERPRIYILQKINVKKDTYYSRLDMGISYVYYHANNMIAEKEQLKRDLTSRLQKRNKIIANLSKKLDNTPDKTV